MHDGKGLYGRKPGIVWLETLSGGLTEFCAQPLIVDLIAIKCRMQAAS